uniref:ectopic P granules protein 5 homolog n=1 Tax=Styela clava TaxID=7725 RepID=UPI00193AA5B9|nr:ectopic P granules protein 5 homolog [Styela clava]
MEFYDAEEFDGESFDLESPLDEVVLPYQEEDWELSNESQQQVPYADGNIQWEDLVPYTQEQLASFYRNGLLERSSIYTDQFLENSKDHNSDLKQLLITLKKATEVVCQLQDECKERNINIQGLCQRVFDNEVGQVKAEGYCQDKRKVHTIHPYTTCKFNEAVASELGVAILDCQHLAVEDTMLAMYTRTLTRLQCEQYLFNAATNVRYHTKNYNENTDSIKSSILVKLAEESIDVVRQCINTLFYFLRKEEEVDTSFGVIIQGWICQLVCLLFEITKGDYQNLVNEELFITNHIIRCPPKSQSWAENIVQISSPSIESDYWSQKLFLDHVIHMLFLILRAPKGRGEFLSGSKSIMSLQNQTSSEDNWTFLDENGDDLKGVGSQWHILPKESDMVSLYRQIPFEKVLSQIFCLCKNENGAYLYKNEPITSEKFLEAIACCDIMCDVLGEGLATLGAPRYKQLVRRIAQTLRNIVLLMSEEWNFFKESTEDKPQIHSIERLQTEFDEFVKRCVERLLCVARLGVYQFLADLPFKSVSQRAAETLYVLMNVPAGSRAEVDQLAMTKYTRQEWLDFVQDTDTKLAFEDRLSEMPENEIVYLLTTFCNLAHARPATEDHLINIIAMDVYMVSFVYSSTRDICSKMGRELLCTVASMHPFIISTILQYLHTNSEKISSTAFYAVSDLPFNQWIPTKQDIELLRNWILDHAITSVPVRLVQCILRGMNWGTGEDGCLFLPHSLHCEIALLLVEVCHFYEMERKQSGLLLKSIDHVSKVASAMRSSLSVEEAFETWVWNILLRLKLHRAQLNCTESLENRDKPSPLMDANEGTLLPRSNMEKLPHSSYVTIMMTSVGHSLNVFLQQGLTLLKNLIESGQKIPAVQCLAFVIPMFIQGGIDLSINNTFVRILRSCIVPDAWVLSSITSKLVEQKPDVPLFLELLMGSISDLLTINDATTVLTYWIKMVLATPGWWEDCNSKILLDFLFKCAFHDSPECSFECGSILYEHHYELMTHNQNNSTSPKHQNRSVLSSIINAVSGGNSSGAPSFAREIQAHFTYLFYYLISAESRFEDDSKLWTTMLPMMKSNTAESSLKKASSQLKLQHHPALHQLALYRWAQLVILTLPEHPLVSAICQNFFLRYIHTDPYVGASMGPKFFKGSAEDLIFKKLDTKINSMCNGQTVEGEFEMKLQKLYRTFGVWLEEEKLHDDHLYLPSLPSHYEPDLLATIRTQNKTIWTQYINFSEISDEIKQVNKKWNNFHTHNFKPFPSHSSSLSIHATSCQRITQLLRQFESPLNLDPSLASAIDFPILVDQLISSTPETLVGDIEQDVKSVLTHAQTFADSKTKLENFNRNYLELLPDLYTNEEQRKLVKVECQSAFSPTHRCAGPAQFPLSFLEKSMNDIASENLKKNRASYREIISVLTNPDTSQDFSYSAVHLITVVQALLKKAQSSDNDKALFENGAKLFYNLADLNSDERWKCPPTRHLLITCIDMLGQVFIYGQPDQAVTLLEQMLKRPETAALLSAHFSPAKSCSRVKNEGGSHTEFDTKVFVDMYKRVVNAASTGNSSDILFVLITKFDLENWCDAYMPPKSEKVTLLDAIINGLVSHTTFLWPPEDSTEETTLTRSQSTQLSNSAVQEVFMTHLSILVQHSQDQVFFEAINSLLEASYKGSVDPIAWEVLTDAAFNPQQSNVQNSARSESKCGLSFEIVDTAIKQLAVYFSEKRKTTKSGLYSTWKPYVHPLSKLFHKLINFEINYNESKQGINGTTYFSHHACLVDRILPLFSAWLDPLKMEEKMQWPWKPDDQETVSSILTVFATLINSICSEKTMDVSQSVSSLWEFYLNNSLLAHEKTSPSYICGSYQTTLSALPWNKFIPNLTDLDKMVQLCNTRIDCSLHFLCHVVPQIDWSAIMKMCFISSPENSTHQWSEHTSEVLCYLLHVLYVLSSNEARLHSYPKLQHLLTSIDVFPWHLIGYDQFDFIANIIADQFHAFCTIFDCEDQKLQSPRYAALRLLQIASGLPVLEKDFDWKKVMENCNSKETVDITWMKRQSFIRCVGTLVRNSAKTQDKREIQTLEAVTSNLVMKLMRSILLVVQFDSGIDETRLSSLYSEIWRSMNTFTPKLQEITRSQILSFLNEVVLSTLDLSMDTQSLQTVDLVLTSILSSAANTISSPLHLAVVAEYGLDSCLKLISKYHPEVNDEVDKTTSDDTLPKVLNLWQNLCHTLSQVCKVSQSELIEACLSNGCINTILALSQNIVDEAKRCGNGNDSNGPMYSAFFSIVQWISSLIPKSDNEAKLLLLIGYALKVCDTLEQDAKLSPESEVNLSSVSESFHSLLPMLEHWSTDRVKTGILGTFGIGRATSLSIGFRVSIRCISVHIQQITARLRPEGEDTLTKAQIAIDSLRKMPLENRTYTQEIDRIHELLDLIQQISDKPTCAAHLSLMKNIFAFHYQKEADWLHVL